MTLRQILQKASGKRGITILPAITGALYALYKFKTFNLINMILLLAALICLEVGITGLSGYFVRDRYVTPPLNDLTDKYRKKKRGLNKTGIFLLLYFLLTLALTIRSGFVVFLLMGLILFQGALYRGGPIPVVGTYRSEFTTGFGLGLIVPLTAALIHLTDKTLRIWIFQSTLLLEGNLKHLGMIVIVMLPVVTALTNIILTDNIIDMEDDKQTGRFTLPIIMGREKALLLYNLLYIIGAVSVVIAMLTKSLPYLGVIILLSYSLVFKNARTFSGRSHREKGNTLAQENFLVIIFTLIVTIVLGINFNL